MRELTRSTFRRNRFSEVLIMVQTDTLIEPDKFTQQKEWVNLQNGVYNIQTREFKERTEENINDFSIFNFLGVLPFPYNEKKQCEKIDKFFHEVQQNREDDIKRLYEWFGYCLYADYPIKRLAMFVGPTNTGKSTTAELLKIFLGEDNVSHESMQSLVDDSFSRKKLFRKKANISGELSPKYLSDTTFLKEATGKDTISVRVMFSQEDFSFTNTAKFLFLANQLPATRDEDDAYYSRLEIWEFTKQFMEGKDMNNKLIDELSAVEELTGLFNRCVKALQELLKRGKFTSSKTIEEKKALYSIQSNSYKVFVDNNLLVEVGKGLYITKQDFYDNYVAFCGLSNVIPISENNFFKRFDYFEKKHGLVEKYIKCIDGKQRWCVMGISLKRLFVNQQDTSSEGNEYGDDFNKYF